MTKTYKTCPGPGWYWCRVDGMDRVLRERRRGDDWAYCPSGNRQLPLSRYTDFEPVSIVPREVEEKMTRGEEIVHSHVGGPISDWGETGNLRKIADAIDRALDEEREKAVTRQQMEERAPLDPACANAAYFFARGVDSVAAKVRRIQSDGTQNSKVRDVLGRIIRWCESVAKSNYEDADRRIAAARRKSSDA